MPKIILVLSLLCVTALCAPNGGKSGSAPSANHPAPAQSGGSLDTGLVRDYYQDGDFERAIPILEYLLKSNASLSHADSVFIFKHLGVMYAAGENTRERGKYFMLQLLHIEPTARIMDMYASDMIYMIFRNIQEEYFLTRARLDRAEGHVTGNQARHRDGQPKPAPTRRDAVKTGSSRQALYWIGAVTALAGAGVATYVLTQDQPVATKPHNIK